MGITNPTLGGYVLSGLGVVTIVIFMTSYYFWPARSIASDGGVAPRLKTIRAAAMF